jgi:hypothetical protein
MGVWMLGGLLTLSLMAWVYMRFTLSEDEIQAELDAYVAKRLKDEAGD